MEAESQVSHSPTSPKSPTSFWDALELPPLPSPSLSSDPARNADIEKSLHQPDKPPTAHLKTPDANFASSLSARLALPSHSSSGRRTRRSMRKGPTRQALNARGLNVETSVPSTSPVGLYLGTTQAPEQIDSPTNTTFARSPLGLGLREAYSGLSSPTSNTGNDFSEPDDAELSSSTGRSAGHGQVLRLGYNHAEVSGSHEREPGEFSGRSPLGLGLREAYSGVVSPKGSVDSENGLVGRVDESNIGEGLEGSWMDKEFRSPEGLGTRMAYGCAAGAVAAIARQRCE
ncbi:hypothetical protein HDU93_009006 [Gonapodya sp. JEL0774]|nr:hypothetical protein HDU93_009006 [Gonapodya sp. JEL0774]